MITGYFHTAFIVSDLDRSVAFYRDILGLAPTRIREVDGAAVSDVVGYPDARVRIGSFSFGSHEIELIQYVSPVGDRPAIKPNTIGSAHVAFFVDDIEAMYRRMRDQGVRFKSPPAGFGEVKSCYFTDPDGITLELFQR